MSAINCPQSLPPLDINNGGRPFYPSTGNQSYAGLCGPWIRPLAYRHVAQMRTICPDLPIAGGGGLMNWRHSVEMLMYGATVLTYCSLLYLKGYKAFTKIEPGVRRFMDEHGYETLADMRGIALKYIVTPGEVDYIPMLPEIDLEKCNGCGLCAAPGHCECIEIVDGKAVLVKSDGLLLVRRLLLPLRARRHPHEGGADRGDAGRRRGRWSDDRPGRGARPR